MRILSVARRLHAAVREGARRKYLRRKARPIWKTSERAFQLLLYQLRFRIGRIVLIGEDRNFDLAVRVAAAEVLFPEFKDYPEFANEIQPLISKSDKQTVAQLLDRVHDDVNINTNIARFLQLMYLVYSTIEKTEETRRSKAALDRVGAKVPSDINRFVRAEDRIVRDQLSKATSVAKDASTIKLDLSSSQIGGVLSLVSALFALSGYIYNSVVYGSLGIDVSLFFSLTDYLATSVEKIRYAAWSGALGVVVMFIGLNTNNRNPKIRFEGRRAKLIDVNSYALIAALLILAAYQYLVGNSKYINILSVAAACAGIRISANLAVTYFVRPVIAMFSLTFLITFSALLFAAAYTVVVQVRTGIFSEYQEVRVVTMNNPPDNFSKNVLIGANSNYLFYYNAAQNQSLVIPKVDVQLFEIGPLRPQK